MEELWKDITGYEGRFQVSNTGLVMNSNYRNSGARKLGLPVGPVAHVIAGRKWKHII